MARQTRSWFGIEIMSTTVLGGQKPFSLGDLSYITSSYEERPAVPRPPTKRSIFTWLHKWRQRRQVAVELTLMTDHELADIGLSRADLSRVFDPDFAANHARDRGLYR
jgi:uncharacterized protein YjiS (DUF1127 family)